MEILRIYINITETNEVISENTTVRMILFDGNCTGDFFNGTILNGGVDTQLISKKNQWLEREELTGILEHPDGKLVIRITT